ncbi:winged helix-turn-helix transcriptional regulator [Candidatus Pacearchaeota archaeon]|nr:winged helix-turn-helix transcriptional regulator [Candidatus Pacearchaeota archaeon]
MDYIKEAFNKVKQDIDFLKDELNNLKKELKENRELMIKICENVQEMFSQLNQTHTQLSPAHRENIPADNSFFEHSNTGNLRISTGNEGVPADRQTNQQTDRQTKNSIENAVEMYKSLDNLKKEIYTKFKKLTEQEWLVFSTIYQFDEENGYSDYRILAEKLNLTESSIRDYVSRLINKGIPIDKTKLNNKNIRLNISQSLKQIASLSNLLYLRDL